MGGLTGSKSSGANYAAAYASPVSEAQLPGSSIPVGYNFGNPLAQGSPQAGYGLQAPSWAQGVWSMPWWGQAAPSVGQALLQQQQGASYGQQPTYAAPQQQQASGIDPEQLQALLEQLRRQQEQISQLNLNVNGPTGMFGMPVSQG